MANQELINYITNELQAGYSKETIITTLISNGYSNEDIQQAFFTINQPQQQTIPSSGSQTLSQQEPQAQVLNEPFFTKKRIAILSGILIVFIALLSSIYYFYFYIYLSPERVMGEMVKKMLDLKTVTYVFDYEGSYEFSPNALAAPLLTSSSPSLSIQDTQETIPKEMVNLLVHASGEYDQTVKDQLKASATLKFTLVSEGLSISVGANLIGYGDTLYAELTEAPALGFISFKSIENKWVKFPQSSTESVSRITNDQIAQVKDLFLKSNIVKKITKLEDEKINDKNTFHYGIDIDKIALINFLAEQEKILGTQSESSPEQLKKTISELNFEDIQIWINKSDYYLNKLSLNINPTTNTPNINVTGKIVASLMNHNETKFITEPSKSLTMDELLQEAMGEYAKNAMPTPYQLQLSPTPSPQLPNQEATVTDVKGTSTNTLEDIYNTVKDIGNIGMNSFKNISKL